MRDRVYLSEELLRPVAPEQPSGRDLRYDPIYGEILEARGKDEALGKLPRWDIVAERSLDALAISKDLRLCCLMTEAAIFLDGFAGLRDGLRLTREILARFWDKGLFPLIEDGDLDYRGAPLAWFNGRMADAVRLVPITDGLGASAGHSLAHYNQAERIDEFKRKPGDQRAEIERLIGRGWITMDTFDAAMRASKRATVELLCEEFNEARQQFTAFEATVGEKLGEAAPGFQETHNLFEELGLVLESALKKKREEKPVMPPPVGVVELSQPTRDDPTRGVWTAGMAADSSDQWQQAEAAVREGKIDNGLKQMATLAAQETSGRGRFLRKLMMVDVCRNAGRERLARTILEELNQQIGEHKLDRWESTALVGAVWSRLYRLYKKAAADSAEQAQAVVLYDQLCHLDPWQAYHDCED